MPKFKDTPKRTRINKAGLLAIYERMFGADGKHLLVPALRANIQDLGRCECGCKKPFKGGRVDYDHIVPLALQIQEDDKPAPDIKWQALHRNCHAEKTKKDKASITKAKHQAGLSGQQYRRKTKKSQWQKGGKIPSRKLNQEYKSNARIDG